MKRKIMKKLVFYFQPALVALAVILAMVTPSVIHEIKNPDEEPAYMKYDAAYIDYIGYKIQSDTEFAHSNLPYDVANNVIVTSNNYNGNYAVVYRSRYDDTTDEVVIMCFLDCGENVKKVGVDGSPVDVQNGRLIIKKHIATDDLIGLKMHIS